MRSLRNRLPPVSSLVVFEAAARQLSFTLAAVELGVTQAAVSRQIRALENNLNVALFKRLHRSLQLTFEGKKLQHAVTLSLEYLASTVAELTAAESAGPIRVVATMAVASFWLMPRLPEFSKAFPDIDVQVLATDQELERLGESFNVAICYGDGQWPGYTAIFLANGEVFPVCSPDYLVDRPVLEQPADLLAETLLFLEDERWSWIDWRLWLAEQGLKLPARVRGLHVNSYPLLIQAAENGQGIALGWRYLVDRHLARGVLVRPLQTTLQTRFSFYLVIRKDVAQSSEIDIFCDWVRAAFAADAAVGVSKS